jgi:Dna[CI] antecedent, DciA
MTDRRSPDQPDFDRLGRLLPETGPAAARRAGGPGDIPGGAPAAGMSADDLSQKLASVWADVVGAEVAENARPVQLRDGRLVVTTSSSAWAQTLQLMSPMVVAGLNERLGEGLVEKAVFRHAGWDVFAGLDGRKAGDAGSGPTRGRQGRGERKPARRAAPAAGAPQAAEPPAAPERGPEAGTPAADAISTAAPARAQTPADPEAFSEEEKQALADLERLPLAPSVKQTIREAMKAGFARARQDSGRS